MLLTNEEVGALTIQQGLTHVEVPLLADLIRKAEAATIAKLCEGVDLTRLDHLFAEAKVDLTRREVETMIAAAVARERERCAVICETAICDCCWDDGAKAAAEHLAAAIRGEQT